MKNKHYVLLAIALGIAGAALGATLAYSGRAEGQVTTATSTAPTLTHPQEVWKYALEWCESNGRTWAVNPHDRDNTPSYGGYQFKPSTLTYYATLYGVATTTDVMDYETQSAVVDQMILHREEIDWPQQFPDCVRKLGYPPRAI